MFVFISNLIFYSKIYVATSFSCSLQRESSEKQDEQFVSRVYLNFVTHMCILLYLFTKSYLLIGNKFFFLEGFLHILNSFDTPSISRRKCRNMYVSAIVPLILPTCQRFHSLNDSKNELVNLHVLE